MSLECFSPATLTWMAADVCAEFGWVRFNQGCESSGFIWIKNQGTRQLRVYIQGNDCTDLLWSINWIREEERTSMA